MEVILLVAGVGVMLTLDALITRVASGRTARRATRSRARIPHARPITRSRYMAHPNHKEFTR